MARRKYKEITRKEVEKLYFYNVFSSKKIVHLNDCRYIKTSAKQKFGYFGSLKEAIKNGYRPCRHCFTLIRRFAEEEERINKYCMRYNYILSHSKDSVEITTGKGQWKIVHAQNSQRVELYHKNTEIRSTDCFSRIEGYHNQRVSEYELGDYIHYIFSHDGRRKAPPAKGTKRYKSQQKRLAIQARRNSINNVICLIDSLQLSRAG